MYVILKNILLFVCLLSVKYESCFDKMCAQIVACLCLRVLASTFAFVTLHLSRFFDIQAVFQALKDCQAVLNIVWTLNIYRMTQAKVVHGTAVQGCRKIRSFVKFL